MAARTRRQNTPRPVAALFDRRRGLRTGHTAEPGFGASDAGRARRGAVPPAVAHDHTRRMPAATTGPAQETGGEGRESGGPKPDHQASSPRAAENRTSMGGSRSGNHLFRESAAW